MAFGIANPALGYLAFCSVKFAGYAFSARWILRLYERPEYSVFALGAVRTVTGQVAGAAYLALWEYLPATAAMGEASFLFGLIPLRLAEWWLLLRLLHPRPEQFTRRDWLIPAGCTLWSHVLDVPALLAFFYAGGVSVG